MNDKPTQAQAMNLASFITANLDPILAEWDRFARSLLPSAASMDHLALRDHAREILEAIAKDIVRPQTAAESGDKSQGTEDNAGTMDTPAAVHGALRHTAGFDLPQLFAEYRALRASVLRLWSERPGEASPDALYQMTRFNEAIDQALAESVSRFSEDVARSRDTFIAVLGHDLLSPLQAVSASVATMEDPAQAERHAAALLRIRASGLAMSRAVRDLLEYTRTRLGKAIPIHPAPANVEAIVHSALGEVGAGYPQRSFRVETGKDLVAEVDSPRLQQAITNLLGNAVEHGRQGSTIELIARKDGDSVAIEVSNEGAAIPPDALQAMFDPMLHPAGASRAGTSGLGLGLFIAREIVQGHGGSIEARSSDRRTTFAIRIPLSEKKRKAEALSAAA